MNHLIRKCILAGLCSGAANLALADVTVNFVNTERYTDVPRQAVQRDATIDEFAAHFKKLSATLPKDVDLVVDVLDIDLAGRARPSRRPGEDLRLVGSSAFDWPHLVLRYTLSEHGKTVAASTVELTDKLDADELRAYPAGSNHPREMRLIDAWWRQTVQPVETAAR